MTTHPNRSTVPNYPDAEAVVDRLVADRTEWIPGPHPDCERRYDGQRAYREEYYRCIRCGVECVSTADFPDHCGGF
jgi:hypothetical protein